jgi:hypothetical protein
MATRKTTKTSTRKTTPKRKPRTAANAEKARRSPRMEVATAKGTKTQPKVTEKKVGDQAKLDAAVEAAGAWREATTKRDAAIKAAVKSGTSARQVAIAVGLTHPAVLKIVKR